MAFEITYKKSVGKDLAGLGKAEARRILGKIEKELPARADSYTVLKDPFSGHHNGGQWPTMPAD